MIRIIDSRNTGKTSQLMLLAKENNADFVCSNPRAMEYKAKQYGIDGIHFISYGEFANIPSMSREGSFVIDELEGFIQTIYFFNDKTNLVAYTMSEE